MNTSAINSPLAVLTPAASNSKQDTSAASDAGAFNQVLSREMADRNNAGNANSTSSSSNEVSKNTQKDASGKDDKSATNNTGTTNEASGTSDADKATTDPKTTSATDGKKDDVDAAIEGPSAELLAFVAALTQANTPAAQVPVTDAVVETTASAKISDIDAKLDTTLGVTNGAAASSEKDAVGKKADFVTALTCFVFCNGIAEPGLTTNFKPDAPAHSFYHPYNCAFL